MAYINGNGRNSACQIVFVFRVSYFVFACRKICNRTLRAFRIIRVADFFVFHRCCNADDCSAAVPARNRVGAKLAKAMPSAKAMHAANPIKTAISFVVSVRFFVPHSFLPRIRSNNFDSGYRLLKKPAGGGKISAARRLFSILFFDFVCG